mmetsp:Transcript_14848/g.41037  ORF Transcript_14848/g.41037 Transcript_14848/m.41037 type:complete len:245 (-) Transcript_14848:500-1234(-)
MRWQGQSPNPSPANCVAAMSTSCRSSCRCRLVSGSTTVPLPASRFPSTVVLPSCHVSTRTRFLPMFPFRPAAANTLPATTDPPSAPCRSPQSAATAVEAARARSSKRRAQPMLSWKQQPCTSTAARAATTTPRPFPITAQPRSWMRVARPTRRPQRREPNKLHSVISTVHEAALHLTACAAVALGPTETTPKSLASCSGKPSDIWAREEPRVQMASPFPSNVSMAASNRSRSAPEEETRSPTSQ